MKKSLVMLLTFALFASWGAHSGISQKRNPYESYLQVMSAINKLSSKSNSARSTPMSRKVTIDKVDYSNVPVVNSYSEMVAMFKLIRDTRFLHAKTDLSFERRISWMYPDDGCFARAALAGMKLRDQELLRPVKIFIFGDLSIQTPYAVSGTVTWWYHVSSAVSYMGAIFILDPALDSEKPILVDDWYNKMGDINDMKVAICNPYTYDPIDDCYIASKSSDADAVGDQLIYLDKEWKRIGVLGFNPTILLGVDPPWNIY